MSFQGKLPCFLGLYGYSSVWYAVAGLMSPFKRIFLLNKSFWTCGLVTVGKALDLRLQRLWVRLPALRFQVTNIGQVVHTHVPLSQSSIICYWSRGGDALECRTGHALQTSVRYPPAGSRSKKGRWAPRLHSLWSMAHYTFMYNVLVALTKNICLTQIGVWVPWKSGKCQVVSQCLESEKWAG